MRLSLQRGSWWFSFRVCKGADTDSASQSPLWHSQASLCDHPAALPLVFCQGLVRRPRWQCGACPCSHLGRGPPASSKEQSWQPGLMGCRSSPETLPIRSALPESFWVLRSASVTVLAEKTQGVGCTCNYLDVTVT